MNKKINILIVTVLILGFSFVSAQTKPSPGIDTDSVSYIFYLYYNNGQILADRDYPVNYDVVNEKFVEETSGNLVYRGEISNNKSEVIQTFAFDPQKGDQGFKTGKVSIKGPYAPNGFKANFFDASGNPVLVVSVNASSICDGDGFCNGQLGEDTKTCPADCPVVKITPAPVPTDFPIVEDGFNLWGFNLIQLLTYLVGGLGVAFIAWLGWKWWKKRKESDFPLPPPSTTPPAPPSLPSFGG